METTTVNLMEVGVKAKSKSEIYRALTINGGLYLIPQKECGMAFISDICFGKKKCLFSNDVKVCSIPHVDGLRSENILDFIVRVLKEEEYLPSNYIEYHPSRVWLCNLANTLSHEKFIKFVQNVLDKREKSINKKRNFTIDIDKRIAELLTSSQMVSVSKGKSHMLLRKSLLRGKKDEHREKEKEMKEELDIVPELKEEIKDLKLQLEETAEELERRDKDAIILLNLFEKGIIDRDGNIIEKIEF